MNQNVNNNFTEYAIAAQMWKLNECDLCEIAMNSMRQTGANDTPSSPHHLVNLLPSRLSGFSRKSGHYSGIFYFYYFVILLFIIYIAMFRTHWSA